jgi:hypothetical protein
LFNATSIPTAKWINNDSISQKLVLAPENTEEGIHKIYFKV